MNERPAIARDVYDELRAVLHDCVVHGPDAQNRAGHPDFRAHLRGRVAFVESVQPERGKKLAAVFARIRWSE